MEILAQNCRIPHSVLGRALGVSKDTVTYRIRQLEEAGLISEYVLFIDVRKFGLARNHLLVQFESGSAKTSDIIQGFTKNDFVMWINTFVGKYDVQIIVDAVNGFHLNEIKEELFNLCKRKIMNYSILTCLFDLEFTQLNPHLDLGTSFEKKEDGSFSNLLSSPHFPVAQQFDRYNVDALEIEILRVLADDPRKSLTTISQMVGCDRQTVKKKLVRLIEKGVILSFGAIPNVSKLGYVTYYLLVRVLQDTPQEILRKPFRKLRNIFYAAKMTGDYDMVLYLNARTPQELNGSIERVNADLGSYLLNYDLLVQDRVYYWKQFTPGLYSHLRQKLRGSSTRGHIE